MRRPSQDRGGRGVAPPATAAANLTPGPAGLGGWTYAQFANELRSGKRSDGTRLWTPMADVIPFARNMTSTELQALWKDLRCVPPVGKGS